MEMARRPGKSAAEVDSDVEHCRDDLNDQKQYKLWSGPGRLSDARLGGGAVAESLLYEPLSGRKPRRTKPKREIEHQR